MIMSAGEVFEHISAMENEFSQVQDKYDQCRMYYETIQYPTDKNGKKLVPDDYDYLIIQKIKPYVDFQVSKVIGGKIDITLKGKQENLEGLRLFLGDVLEKNKFHEYMLYRIQQNREVEGLCGINTRFDPAEQSEYGLGAIKLDVVNARNGQVLLDPNAKDGMHEDDRMRCLKYKLSMRQALTNPRWKKHWDDIRSGTSQDGHESKKHVDAYEFEFCEEYFIPSFFDPTIGKYRPIREFVSVYDKDFEARVGAKADDEGAEEFTGDFVDDEGAIAKCRELLEIPEELNVPGLAEQLPLVKHKIYFMCTVINRQIMVEPPKPTKHAGFKLAASIHTPNEYLHKYPMSKVADLVYEQDRENILQSMALEITKTGLKNPHIFLGVNAEDEKAYATRKIAGIGEFIFFRDPTIQYFQPKAPEIPAHILQNLQLSEKAFDTEGATSEVDRGRAQQPGFKLNMALQARSDIPSVVQTLTLSNSLVEMCRRILEIAKFRLDEPFMLQGTFEGEERDVYFNTPLDEFPGEIAEDDKLHAVSERGIVNDLAEIEIPTVGIDIETDSLTKEQMAIEKAGYMYNLQQLHPRDLHRAVYPEKWFETFEAAQEWNQGMALAQQLSQLSEPGKEYVMKAVQTAVAAEMTAGDMVAGGNGKAGTTPRPPLVRGSGR